jgi:hypothetical protein
MSEGAFSISKFMQSLKMGTVVSNTRIVKMNAVIGSAILCSG